MSVRMVLSSEDGKEYFSNNQPFDFRINLGKVIQFVGYWMVAIADVTVTEWENSYGPTVELFIYLDICQDTFIGGAEFPLLRRVYIANKK
jgi:hypothetical protein